ncbi:multidrug effflux MFS transporter [Demequina pelophila]|uniref:multidrug effflux MFS transporter n=1 Tax=Demequina pelophila TaxID=1638984 RepID=UPI000781980B|nr:multidrug effflux MFS transporter [Demequina pelophila]
MTTTLAPDTIAHSPGDLLTRRQRLSYVLMLGALVALGPFTVDLYLPAFPQVAAELQATDAAIQLTLTATMIGFGLGQLVVGPLSDALGRKRPLLAATALHIVASIFVSFAPTVELVMAGRVLQGIGAAGGGVVAVAIVRDLFAGQRLIRMLANLALVTGLAPVLAPVIGSQLLRVMDWRGVFVALAGYGIVMVLVAGLLLVETMPETKRGTFTVSATAGRYKKLLGDKVFVGVAIVGSMAFTALFAYLSSSSFVLQDIFGLSPQEYGLVFGMNSVGLVIANQTSARVMKWFPPRAVATAGLAVMATGSVLLLVAGLLDLGLIGVLIPLFFVVASLGIIGPAVQITALKDHAGEAGTAASLLGALNFGVAGIVSPVVGVLGVSVVSMAVVMIGALTVAHLVFWIVVRPRMETTVVA